MRISISIIMRRTSRRDIIHINQGCTVTWCAKYTSHHPSLFCRLKTHIKTMNIYNETTKAPICSATHNNE